MGGPWADLSTELKGYPSQDNSRNADESVIPPGLEDEFSQQGPRYFDGRRIYRVPDALRKKNKEDCYAPKMASFGPYNHGSPGLHVAEKFKAKVLEIFVSDSGRPRNFFFNKIFEVIDQVRNCYDGISIDKYKDCALANMMLQDTFFLIYLMQRSMGESKYPELLDEHLGMSAIPFLYPDMLLLDNQIPLSVINLLTSLIYSEEEEEQESPFILRFLLKGLKMDDKITSILEKDENQPLHLLDACWRGAAKEVDNTQGNKEVLPAFEDLRRHFSRPFRSVSDLKAKGIYFKPNNSHCVKDIKFQSWTFFGQLQLPTLLVDISGKVIFQNMIAFEMSPGSTSDLVITSYINFMKSLIASPKDVNDLREEKILISNHDNDEQVMKEFKDIDTYGLDNLQIFDQVKMRINAHCSSKAKTWMAELAHTYFRNPWTFIGLLAASFLLFLSTVQAYYAKNPPK
ncbi:Plant protein of unknown function (DUF247) [Abeliophyllum distichum]|uniref:Uncharacterized protein n=1 Tax=Abeliophyllum distichum TaxID=126358 RepID=A0ABD1QX13_9LAMI